MSEQSERAPWAPVEVVPSGGGDARPAALVERLVDTAGTDALLAGCGAVVFRGFRLTEADLDSVLDLLLPNRLAYVHGNSPRTKVGRDVYTSTEYPPAHTISMHNEMSYAARWPARLAFFCDRAAGTGGATPVVDGQRWLAALDPGVRAAFAGGVRYTQNLHGGKGFGKSWQETFETDDRGAVERFLADAEAQWWWRPDGGLRVTQLRAATTRHPGTGAEVWFSQADQWHPDTLGDEVARALRSIMPEEDMPQAVSYADGAPIPAEHVRHVRERGLAEAVDVDWRAGDLLLVDNVRVAHGRRPFTGPRRVLVAMSD
ncbi:TauD/TfdA family dioxygenase [Actinokineospora sp. PR83]|uniref:TauD/TfdA family dioxygenase n=1 Tax=Actinokineospora sp. PR83 TaxID=2884908 RepID=UPI001F1B1F26|nr:TauD/TfdA family dioxygenase [Actinokineospora sp. PR83]MCG8914459.1 TauD/TfdA family dioxygenase [Actinokineospora sp. PR83]